MYPRLWMMGSQSIWVVDGYKSNVWMMGYYAFELLLHQYYLSTFLMKNNGHCRNYWFIELETFYCFELLCFKPLWPYKSMLQAEYFNKHRWAHACAHAYAQAENFISPICIRFSGFVTSAWLYCFVSMSHSIPVQHGNYAYRRSYCLRDLSFHDPSVFSWKYDL